MSLIERKLKNPILRKQWVLRYPLFEVEAQLKKALEEKKWTYARLAKKMGTSKSNICRDFKDDGIKKATLSRIVRLAYELGLSPIIIFVKITDRKYFADKVSSLFDDPATYTLSKVYQNNGGGK